MNNMPLIIATLVFAVLIFGAYFFRARFFKAPSWFRLAYGIAALGLVSYIAMCGTAQRRATEPVWAKNARTWSKVPLEVTWDQNKELKPYNEGIRYAMKTWNREVGCALFIEARMYAVVRIKSADFEPCGVPESVLGKDDVAGAWYCPDGTAEIQLIRVDAIDTTYQIIMHELGHVLGLDHDESELMGASFRPITLIIPSPKDAAALRARYCH